MEEANNERLYSFCKPLNPSLVVESRNSCKSIDENLITLYESVHENTDLKVFESKFCPGIATAGWVFFRSIEGGLFWSRYYKVCEFFCLKYDGFVCAA